MDFFDILLIIWGIIAVLFIMLVLVISYYVDKFLTKHSKKYAENKRIKNQEKHLQKIIKRNRRYGMIFFDLTYFNSLKDDAQNQTRFYLSDTLELINSKTNGVFVIPKEIAGKLISYGENEISIKFQKDGIKRLVFLRSDDGKYRLKLETNELKYGEDIYSILSKQIPFLLINDSQNNKSLKKMKIKKRKDFVYEIGVW